MVIRAVIIEPDSEKPRTSNCYINFLKKSEKGNLRWYAESLSKGLLCNDRLDNISLSNAESFARKFNLPLLIKKRFQISYSFSIKEYQEACEKMRS